MRMLAAWKYWAQIVMMSGMDRRVLQMALQLG
jgi:hypothetical protein